MVNGASPTIILPHTFNPSETLMPRGPKGEKHPADAIGAAVMAGRIATGEIEDQRREKNAHAVALGREGGFARAVDNSGASL